MKHLVLFAVLSAACVASSPASVTAAPVRVIAPGDRLSVRWSTGSNVDGINEPSTVTCTDVISHPCPFVLYTHEVDIAADGAGMSWNHGSGAVDANGVAIETHLPWLDAITIADDGSIAVVSRGDDGGLRYDSTFKPYSADVDGAGGYNSEITWLLFNVAGETHFDVSLTYPPAQ